MPLLGLQFRFLAKLSHLRYPKTSNIQHMAGSDDVWMENFFPLLSSQFLNYSNKTSVPYVLDENLKRELNQVKVRLDRLEKLQFTRSRSTVDNFIESLKASVNPAPIDTIFVRNCAIISFFMIGMIIGKSIFDKFWLLGGIVGFWWACASVNADNTNGIFTRFVGLKVALLILYIIDLYKQSITLWHTGQLAFQSRQIFDSYDQKWGITKKFFQFRDMATERAILFNNAINEYHITDLMKDYWKSILNTPVEVRKIDEEYGISSNIKELSIDISNQLYDSFLYTWNKIIRKDTTTNSNNNNSKWNKWKRKSFWNKKSKSVPVNPWASPLESLKRRSS